MWKGAEGLFASVEGQKEGNLQDSHISLVPIRLLT